MDITTRNFFRLLRAGAFGQEEQIEPISAWKWKRIYQLSLMHGVSALLHDGLTMCKRQFFVQLPEGLSEEWEKSTRDIEQRNIQTNEQLAALFSIFNHQQLRPILLKGQSLGSYYDRPNHHIPEGIDIFFPFQTQGQKADEWGKANGKELCQKDKYHLEYLRNGVQVSHHHRMFRLTNKLLDHSFQRIVEKEIRESSPNMIQINGQQVETVSHTLDLLLILLRIAGSMLNDGVSLKEMTDLGIFLRKQGDKVDYVKLQEWIERLRLSRMAQLVGAILVLLLGFTTDEIPFMSDKKVMNISLILKDLFLLRQSQKSDWYFQQGQDIFVHAANSSAMFWQVRHSARYFRYYPSESFTNLFAAFAHSLSHIEE